MGKEFNQGITFKVYPQAHLRADGMNTIYLRITIDRNKKEINLKVFWPAADFDMVKQEAKSRYKNDPDVEGVNMIINEAKARATRIKMRYFADNKPLSLDTFSKEFENFESRDNFLAYWKEKIDQRRTDSEITEQTRIRHITNLHRFKDFINEYHYFSFSDLSAELIVKFQAWLRKKLMYNTMVNVLKTMQTYINLANADGYQLGNFFEKIDLKYVNGERLPLETFELKKLIKIFAECDEGTYKEVLRRYLFSCFTGLRVSDNSRVHRKMINDGVLKIRPVKGMKFGKEISIPLPDYALSLIEGRKGLIFAEIADQTCNDWLKIIAKDADIKKHLTFHTARDTFATVFLEMGGDVYTLKELLGHTNVQTTMIYVKMSENRKGVLMANFNNL